MKRFPTTIASMAALLALLPATLFAQFGTRLEPRTVQEFERYQSTAESSLTWKPRFSQLTPGEIRIEPAQGDGSQNVDDGIVHDWVAATIVPGATVDGVLRLLKDYASYPEVYAPEVVEAKVLNNNGNRLKVALQMYKKKVMTVVLNGEFDVDYRERGQGRWSMISRSTRIVEVEDGSELPLGRGKGFMWRLNAYWLIEPRPGGVYLEVRSLSLSRGIPFGLGVVIRPFVTSVPRESLTDTMTHTVDALKQQVARREAGAASGSQRGGR